MIIGKDARISIISSNAHVLPSFVRGTATNEIKLLSVFIQTRSDTCATVQINNFQIKLALSVFEKSNNSLFI